MAISWVEDYKVLQSANLEGPGIIHKPESKDEEKFSSWLCTSIRDEEKKKRNTDILNAAFVILYLLFCFVFNE